MLRFHDVGDWGSEAIQVRWAASSHVVPPEAAALIEEAWREAMERPGVKLFDGPMCRMESWAATPDRLELVLSLTSYKLFLGTNLTHPELAEQFGRQVLANPIGVSPALESADGYLLLGRRNSSLAYYPGGVHPFAGALEPRDGLDLFGAVRRELAEELSFGDADVSEIRCTGIVEDVGLRQPEVIFRVHSPLTRDQIYGQVKRDEHHEGWAIPATSEAIESAVRDPALTPVAVAALVLWGRVRLGDEWFNSLRMR